MTKNVIEFLKNDMLDSINDDIAAVTQFHGYAGGGYFSIPRQVFCYIDYLGALLSGRNAKSTKREMDFIKTYFDEKYKPIVHILINMWRHGTIHQYKPKTFMVANQIQLLWLSNNSSKQCHRQEHLKCYQVDGNREKIIIVINICQLVDDLKEAICKFIKRLENNGSEMKKVQKNYDRLNENEKYKRTLSLLIFGDIKSSNGEVYNRFDSPRPIEWENKE